MKTGKMNIWRRIGSALCLTIMVGFVACDDDEDDMLLYDTNRFFTDFSSVNVFDAWDLDNDNFLAGDEFTTSFYETWDLDNDGVLAESEWDLGVVDYGLVGADYDVWDTDGDGILEVVEFETGFADVDYYDTWDLNNDGLITEREYTNGVFGLWDVDGDGFLEEVDYNLWYNRYYVI